MNRKPIREYAMILVGVMIMAIGINVFYEPNLLVTGGVTGIAIVVEKLALSYGLKIPLWLTNLALNIPLFLLALKTTERKFLLRTLVATLWLSASLYLTSHLIPFSTTDPVLVSVFGGTVGGVGLALVFKGLATTGGTDLLASVIHRYVRHIPVSRILFVTDGLVILLGMLVFGASKGLYAIIAVFITSKVIDAVLEGFSSSRAAFVISDNADAIALALMNEIERGVTGLSGMGMYTKRSKNVLLCVVSAKELVALKSIVSRNDADAFVIVAEVREVLGDGFTAI